MAADIFSREHLQLQCLINLNHTISDADGEQIVIFAPIDVFAIAVLPPFSDWAFGLSEEKVSIQSWCRTACPEIPVLMLWPQSNSSAQSRNEVKASCHTRKP